MLGLGFTFMGDYVVGFLGWIRMVYLWFAGIVWVAG